MLDKIHEIEKEFDEQFDHYNPKRAGGIEHEQTATWCGSDFEAIKSFLRTSLIALLEGEIEREKESLDRPDEPIDRDQHRYGWNTAKNETIAHYQSIIKDLAKTI